MTCSGRRQASSSTRPRIGCTRSKPSWSRRSVPTDGREVDRSSPTSMPALAATHRGAFGRDAFGRTAERLARFFGTPGYILGQTALVIVWIAINVVAVAARWDPYPFILLNLAFSTQAAYAAPLILLAQNRQADRDRVQAEEDRGRAASIRADTEYLARELASLRVSVGELATREFIRDQLSRLTPAQSDHEERKKDKKK